MAHLVLDRGELGDGYGWPTDGAKRAMVLAQKEGLELDPTYTAKAFAGLVRDAIGVAQGKRLLYWHTLSSADLRPLVESAPPLPDWALRAATSGES